MIGIEILSTLLVDVHIVKGVAAAFIGVAAVGVVIVVGMVVRVIVVV